MIKFAMGAAMALVLTQSAGAALLAYDGFNYNTGSLLGQTNPSSGTNWLLAATSSTTTAINVVSGSLTPPSPITSTGNSVSMSGAGNDSGGANRLALSSAVTSGTVYYSFVMNVGTLTGSNNTTGGFFAGLNNTGNSATSTNPSVVGARIQSRIDPTDGTKYDLGIFGNLAATAGAKSWGSALNVGDTEFVVAAYTFNTSTATDDVSSIWINPNPSTFGQGTAPTPTITTDDTATDTGTAGTDLSTIASIILRQSPAPQTTLDELRVGTAWADVTGNNTQVPEPASAGLLAVGSLLIAARGRKRIA